MTWVSSGTISLAGGTRDHTPRSSASWRTIQRRNRFRRLQPTRPTGAERNSRRPAVLRHAGRTPAVEIERQRTRREAVERAFDVVGARRRRPRRRTPRSIRRGRSSDACIQISATISGSRVQRWTMSANAARRGADRSAGRTRPARGPIDRQHALDRLQHARHPAERQRGGDESDHFTIVGPRVTAGRSGSDRSPNRDS